MSARKVWWSGAWVDIGGGTTNSFPGPALSDSFLTGVSLAPTVTSVGSASPNNFSTPGAWLPIDASLSSDAGGITLAASVATFVSGANSSTLLQIGVGAASSEVVWATIPVGNMPIASSITVPGFIPAGSRVSVRVLSSAVTLKSVTFAYSFLPDLGLGAPIMIGPDATDAQGLGLTYAGSINTPSGWAELTASSSADIDVLTICSQAGGDQSMASSGVIVDIAVGAISSETVVASVSYITRDTEYIFATSPTTMALADTIPAGSRISARYQTGSSTQGTWDVSLVGSALV